MNNKQLPPLPTLQPGDSHMESLIEAAIQGHADTRDAMRWLVRQLVPATQPADVTDADIEQVLALAHSYADAKLMRYGALGIKEPPDPAAAFIELRRAILALRPAAVPMTDEEIFNAYCKSDSTLNTHITNLVAFARAVEAHHGITAQAKKETP